MVQMCLFDQYPNNAESGMFNNNALLIQLNAESGKFLVNSR